ncbi:MAG: hypothetical protein KAT29_06190 [Anaerolineales bacterium]|nr:hypothetical protein [Anaerolineales bacterium]
MNKKRKRKNQVEKSSVQTGAAAARMGSRNRTDNFNPDYTYVKKNLRTIGTLASIFITILVVLSFFI